MKRLPVNSFAISAVWHGSFGLYRNTLRNLLGALIFGVLVSLGANVQADILYVSYYDNNTIHRFGPNGTDLGTFASTGLNGPSGLAFDANGNLFVANLLGNTIHKFGPTGTDLGIFASTGKTQERQLGHFSSPSRQFQSRRRSRWPDSASPHWLPIAGGGSVLRHESC